MASWREIGGSNIGCIVSFALWLVVVFVGDQGRPDPDRGGGDAGLLRAGGGAGLAAPHTAMTRWPRRSSRRRRRSTCRQQGGHQGLARWRPRAHRRQVPRGARPGACTSTTGTSSTRSSGLCSRIGGAPAPRGTNPAPSAAKGSWARRGDTRMRRQLLATKPLALLARGDEGREPAAPGPRARSSSPAWASGAIIGTGIFVLTGMAAHDKPGPALILSFVVAGIACIFAALCYAEFASMVPVAGSAYTYAYATLGELFAWIIGWDLVLEYTVASATVAHGWSHYFQDFIGIFGVHVPHALTQRAVRLRPARSGGSSATGTIARPARDRDHGRSSPRSWSRASARAPRSTPRWSGSSSPSCCS